MARLPRTVFPGLTHLVTQRGNGRAQVFFSGDDYAAYVNLLIAAARAEQVEVLAWCLMPNHAHLLLRPQTEAGISRMMARVSRDYAARIHRRLERTGHFWQGRFGCVALDGHHLRAALGYVLMNPVRAQLCGTARQWRWSNARSLCDGTPDLLSDSAEPLTLRPDLPALLSRPPAEAEEPAEYSAIRRGETIGRPVGSDEFLIALEEATGTILRPQKRGPKPDPHKQRPARATSRPRTQRSSRG